MFTQNSLITEKDVEIKFINRLFLEDLEYKDENLSWNQPIEITFGREKFTKYADLVVKNNQDNLIVVEAKKPTESVQSGISQADSYAFAISAKYSLITNGKFLILRGYYEGNLKINLIESNIDDLKNDNYKALKEVISIVNIVSSSKQKPNQITRPDQNQIRDYRRFFRKLHNIIRDGEKLDPSASFDELSKVLFLKASEEEKNKNFPNQEKLDISKISQWAKMGEEIASNYVNTYFQQIIKQSFPDVFEENTKLNLKTSTLSQLLFEMESFSIKEGDVDIKGRAFEEFLPTQLRGKGLGQFFTPRTVVNFMADMADISIHDTIVDFSCGSGGFLIKAFDKMKSLVDEMPSGIWKKLDIEKNEFMDNLKASQIYGIDAEPRAARTAKMNMIMWGDGKRVVRGNSLDSVDSNGNKYEIQNYNKDIKDSGCSLILANPPFGEKEKDLNILPNYFLGSKEKVRESQKTELLFLERGLKLLRPQGRMLIVIPSGILSNPSYQYVRDYIASEAEIKAVVSLPTHTFVQSGVDTVKTSIMYIEKFTETKKELYESITKGKKPEDIRLILKNNKDYDYSIFFATAEFIGFEPSGRSNVAKGEKTDLDLIIDEFRQQYLIKDELINLEEFSKIHYSEKSSKKGVKAIRGTKKGLKTSFVKPFSELDGRFDPEYYLWSKNSSSILANFESLKPLIVESSNRFKPVTEDEMDKDYSLLSVTNDGKVNFNEYISGNEFTQAYKVVETGDIVYNPYRINIGSIGVVQKENNGGLVSPAYVVFKVISKNSEFIVDLLRSPFFKMYIDIASTGSIRDSFSFDNLSDLLIPSVKQQDQLIISKELRKIEMTINKANKSILQQKEELTNTIHKLVFQK